MRSNNVNKKLVVKEVQRVGYKALCSACSTGKRPKAGRANVQQKNLTEKGNINKMSKKDECAGNWAYCNLTRLNLSASCGGKCLN